MKWRWTSTSAKRMSGMRVIVEIECKRRMVAGPQVTFVASSAKRCIDRSISIPGVHRAGFSYTSYFVIRKSTKRRDGRYSCFSSTCKLRDAEGSAGSVIDQTSFPEPTNSLICFCKLPLVNSNRLGGSCQKIGLPVDPEMEGRDSLLRMSADAAGRNSQSVPLELLDKVLQSGSRINSD